MGVPWNCHCKLACKSFTQGLDSGENCFLENIWISIVVVCHSFMTFPLCNDEQFLHVNESVWLIVMLTSVIVTLNTGVSVCVSETWCICVFTVHASCFSSCQNATPLVRFETLSLMQLALKRATAVVEHCRAQERSGEGMCICRIAPGCCPDTHVFWECKLVYISKNFVCEWLKICEICNPWKFSTIWYFHLVVCDIVDMLFCCWVAVAGSYCVQYCDAVLKSLPDIKTVIALRQQLLGGGTPARMNTDSMSLTPDEIHKNSGM